MKLIKKKWGWELILVSTELYACKLIILKGNYQCSIHYHKSKDETFIPLMGDALLDIFLQENSNIRPQRWDLKFGQTHQVKPGRKHRFVGKSLFSLILEVSTEDLAEDSYRDTVSGKVPKNSR